MAVKVSIGVRIREARDRAGLSQAELARRMNAYPETRTAQPATISRYESDRYQPSVEAISVIAQVLGVSIDSLVRGEDAETRVEFVEDEELSVGDRAIRALGRLEPAEEKDLRAYLAEFQLGTGATRVGPVVGMLEEKLAQIRAAGRAPRTRQAEPEQITPREGAMRREPRRGGKR